jgi:hypothetical protein
MKHALVSLTIGACLLLPSTGVVFAENPHMGSSKGQPGSPALACGTAPATGTPGHAASSPGSPFNEPSATSSGGKAGKVYAGSGANLGTPASGNAVSQYDVACLQVP